MSVTRLGDGPRQRTQPNWNTVTLSLVHMEFATAGSSPYAQTNSSTFALTVVPAFPARMSGRSFSAPMAARFPVASTKRQAASTFGPIEPVGNS